MDLQTNPTTLGGSDISDTTIFNSGRLSFTTSTEMLFDSACQGGVFIAWWWSIVDLVHGVVMLFLISIHEPTVDVESVLTRSYSVKDKILFFHVTLQYNKGRSLSLLFMWSIRWTVTCFIQSGWYGVPVVRKMDPCPIYFGFCCLMTNTSKLD
jgi:hypothetical protein